MKHKKGLSEKVRFPVGKKKKKLPKVNMSKGHEAASAQYGGWSPPLPKQITRVFRIKPGGGLNMQLKIKPGVPDVGPTTAASSFDLPADGGGVLPVGDKSETPLADREA